MYMHYNPCHRATAHLQLNLLLLLLLYLYFYNFAHGPGVVKLFTVPLKTALFRTTLAQADIVHF